MRIERLGAREVFERCFRQAQRPMQKPARPAGIDDESRSNGKTSSLMLAFDLNAIAPNGNASELCLIKVLDAETLRLANEKMIEVRAIPVRVGNFIARTGCHEHLITTFGIRCERLAKLMMIKRKPALQTAANVRIHLLPGSPLCQRQQPRQLVASRQFFQQKVRQRCGGFANNKARMLAALQQNDGASKSSGNHRHERAAETGANDRDVKVHVHSRWNRLR